MASERWERPSAADEVAEKVGKRILKVPPPDKQSFSGSCEAALILRGCGTTKVEPWRKTGGKTRRKGYSSRTVLRPALQLRSRRMWGTHTSKNTNRA
jgi:hypothetical protein